MPDPLKKPEGISWDPAAVELPQMPMVPPGQDAMSATISGVLPTLAAPLTANVAALNAKENLFSGKLVAAQSAYQNADDSGQQSVGQVTGMLGQLGQMGSKAAGSAGQSGGGMGGQSGMFGQLMQQAMQGAQGMGGQAGTGQSVGGPAAGGPATATTGQGPMSNQQQDAPRGDVGVERGEPDERDGAQTLPHSDENAGSAAETARPGDTEHGRAPVMPAEPRQPGDGDDLARRM